MTNGRSNCSMCGAAFGKEGHAPATCGTCEKPIMAKPDADAEPEPICQGCAHPDFICENEACAMPTCAACLKDTPMTDGQTWKKLCPKCHRFEPRTMLETIYRAGVTRNLGNVVAVDTSKGGEVVIHYNGMPLLHVRLGMRTSDSGLAPLLIRASEHVNIISANLTHVGTDSDVAKCVANVVADVAMTIGPELTCAFCGRSEVYDIARDVEGWEPYFYLNETTEVMDPCCRPCASQHMTWDDNGEAICKPGHYPLNHPPESIEPTQ
jgi:hypothetical protein